MGGGGQPLFRRLDFSFKMTIRRLGSVLLCRGFLKHSQIQRVQALSTSHVLRDTFFTKKHEWVRVEGNTGIVGVSAYAADALGDVVYAQLPEPGDSVEAGEECGALESVKAASEIYSPVSGTVAEKNEKVEDGPALINQAPMAEGWLFSVNLTHPEQVNSLMNDEDYQAYLKDCEEH